MTAFYTLLIDALETLDQLTVTDEIAREKLFIIKTDFDKLNDEITADLSYIAQDLQKATNLSKIGETKITQAMIKRVIDQKNKATIDQATEGGINVLHGFLTNDLSTLKKGVDKVQSTEITEQSEKEVAQRLRLLHNLRIQNETDKLFNDFNKNLIETVQIQKDVSQKL